MVNGSSKIHCTQKYIPKKQNTLRSLFPLLLTCILLSSCSKKLEQPGDKYYTIEQAKEKFGSLPICIYQNNFLYTIESFPSTEDIVGSNMSIWEVPGYKEPMLVSVAHVTESILQTYPDSKIEYNPMTDTTTNQNDLSCLNIKQLTSLVSKGIPLLQIPEEEYEKYDFYIVAADEKNTEQSMTGLEQKVYATQHRLMKVLGIQAKKYIRTLQVQPLRSSDEHIVSLIFSIYPILADRYNGKYPYGSSIEQKKEFLKQENVNWDKRLIWYKNKGIFFTLYNNSNSQNMFSSFGGLSGSSVFAVNKGKQLTEGNIEGVIATISLKRQIGSLFYLSGPGGAAFRSLTPAHSQ